MSRKPTAAQQMFVNAMGHHRAGRLTEAEQLYRQVLIHDARHADSLHLLGVIASQGGRHEIAVELIGKAIAIKDNVALYHSSLGNALKGQGRLDEALARYRRAVELKPDDAEAHNCLGDAIDAQGKFDEAAEHYERALVFDPNLAEAHSNLGNALKRQGKLDEAVAHYERAIALRSDFAEAHYNLGVVRRDQGKLDNAAACYDQAIVLRPDFAEARYNLGNVRKDQGRLDDAAACYERAIALRPDYAEARYNLGNVRRDQGRLDDATACYEQVIALRPDYAEAHTSLGNALRSQDKLDQAAVHYQRALAFNPLADAYIGLGNVMLLRGEVEEANRLFRHAQRIRPLKKRTAFKPKPDFSVLLLTAPGAVNTPSDYLVDQACYDSYSLIVTVGAEHDLTLLKDSGDVVVNLISDADHGRDALPLAIDLVERLGRPVINHPRKSLATGRDEIAARLAGTPRCRIPKTIRRRGHLLAAPNTREALAGFAFPLLVRLSGTHGGSDFEKLADHDAVAAFASRRPEADYYVSEYVPYESADGYFRKYRLIFVDGQIFPYHLAICDHWKVHHFRTEMASQEWMRKEEETFVKDPAVVFGAAQWDALHTIQAAIGLDYFGIDCALDGAGNIVVFEVNATMLVHDEYAIFAYKAPYIARIKDAFNAMLVKAYDLAARSSAGLRHHS